MELLKNKPANFEVAPVIDDLLEYRDVLDKAKRVKAKWHLEIDY